MKLQYYAPFGLTFGVVKVLNLFEKPKDGSMRHIFFKTGLNKETFRAYIARVKEIDKQTYWAMVIGPNIVLLAIITMIIASFFTEPSQVSQVG